MPDIADALARSRARHQVIRDLFDGVVIAEPEDRGAAFGPLAHLLATYEPAEAVSSLARLGDMDPTGIEFMRALRALRVEIEAHAAHEQRELLARLEFEDVVHDVPVVTPASAAMTTTPGGGG